MKERLIFLKTFYKFTIILMMLLLTLNINVNAEEINNYNIDNENEQNNIENNSLDEDGIENENIIEEETPIENTEEEIQVQYTKVSISKLNEKEELIAGAKLQIIDSEGNIINEWISDGTIYEIMLPAGKYTLHEVEATEGYEIAEDKFFEVELIIEDEIIGDVDWSETPCDHGENNQTPLYFIEINSISYEVYCINQGVNTPTGIDYNGKIITPDNIRDFTKQETNIDAEGYTLTSNRININTETVYDYDVSDQTMTNQELYDKILDIIYHRQLAINDERFSSLSIAEIRLITEYALKNYLNARITTYETVRVLNGTKINHVYYNINGELWQTGDGTKYLKLYNKYYNREYLYDETSPTGYIISEGNGDAFGNFAKHWYSSHGSKKIPKEYAELFYYLIADEDKHPATMKLYIYSPTATYSDTPYQNLLGITGFLEDVAIREESVSLKSNYNTEKRDIEVNKVWEETNNNEEKPKSVTINLYADGELHSSIELNDENNWKYTFNNLDIYKEGRKIVYTIEEIKVPNYKTEIEGDVEEGFTVTNKPEAQPPVEEEPPIEEQPPVEEILPDENPTKPEDKNPDTSDNIYISVITLFISLTGVIYSLTSIKLKKEVD